MICLCLFHLGMANFAEPAAFLLCFFFVYVSTEIKKEHDRSFDLPLFWICNLHNFLYCDLSSLKPNHVIVKFLFYSLNFVHYRH